MLQRHFLKRGVPGDGHDGKAKNEKSKRQPARRSSFRPLPRNALKGAKGREPMGGQSEVVNLGARDGKRNLRGKGEGTRALQAHALGGG